MFQKRKIYGEKNEGAHMWATVRWSGKNAISPQRILLHPVTRPPEGTYGTLVLVDLVLHLERNLTPPVSFHNYYEHVRSCCNTISVII